MRPYFIMITSSWKYWLSRIATWYSIINFYKSFFSHKSYFNPVFTSWRNNWYAIFLWINSLPYSFLWIYISDSPISNKLKLWSYPFHIFRHCEAHIQASINWNENDLRFICWISNYNTFRWRCFFLSSFIKSCCLLSCLFSLCNFCFSFLSFIKSNYFWFRIQIFLINWQLGCTQCF